ncbi:HNH/endonuclease VII fold putative polymorphic toxin, partial [Pseudomonas helleri]|uniref:HNH/endonuclease VII fold putative polymorphic toxin n=4 Tax=Pseudomonas helleri TaxID=1608996 RepID=UPI003FD6411E
QAKLEAGIPRTQQPDSIYDPLTAETGQYKYVRMTSKNNESILNNEGKPILTREYQFTRADGSIIVIQDHSAGHRFSAPGNAGDQAAHLNLRPIENTRNGKVDGARDHYYFRGKK